MVLRRCSGLVSTSKTSWIGASKARVRTISRSFGNSMRAGACRSGVTAASSLLQLFEVVIHPVHPGIPRLLVRGQPLAQGPEALGLQAVQPATSLRPARDQSHLTEHPQVLGNLGLGHREAAHDLPDRL